MKYLISSVLFQL